MEGCNASICTHRYVSGDLAVLARLIEHIDDLFMDAPTEPAADGSFLVPLRGRILGKDVDKNVRVRVGTACHASDCLRIPVRWQAEPLRHAFPTFEGAIEFQPLDQNLGQLSVVGAYHPPLGPAGAAVDAAGLRR
jgi:hypothetical protein